MNDEVFRSAFDKAKDRIGKMRIRYVELADPVRQALFEVYVAIVLKTKHNDFANH